MWQNFTERGKRVFQLAHSEALRLGHEVIGTEHILLGLLDDADGIVTQILSNYNLHPEVLKAEIESLVGTGRPRSQPVDLPSSPRAKLVIDLSMREARKMGVNYIGTEHILLGILAEGEGMAAQLLASHGMDLPRTRMMVRSILSGNQADPELDPMKSDSAPQSPESRAPSRTPTLDQIGIDLTMMARNSELDPVIGRDKEIQRVVQILSRRTKNNPVLIGEPGVGKTAIAEGLAQRIVSGEIPEILKDKRVMQLNVANLVAGTKYRGEFEERMRKIVKEVREAKKVILFIDEIHTLVGAGGAEGAVDAANIIKPSLSRGEFQVIGATTITEYRKYIEKDAALERRFQPVHVEEPSEEDTVSILKGLRDSYEAHHRVKITDDALEAAAKLSQRYITDRFLPDKAIDLIDEASARARIQTLEVPEDLKALERSVGEIRREKEAAVGSQEFEKAADLRDQERELIAKIAEWRKSWTESRNQFTPDVKAEDIATIVSEWTGIPVTQLTEEESRRLLRMEDEIKQRLVGQDEAIHAVARAIRRSRSGMKDPKRPVGSFMFLGPTGVGKTEMARSLAEFLFGSDDAMIRLDMSEFMERHEAAKLIGAPPGYVGYEEGGKLTEAIRRRPYSVVLFDEIEKAHPDVFNMLLQLLEDGRLTDGQGHLTDFRNAVIIMTSNIGISEAMKGRSLGFAEADGPGMDTAKMRSTVLDAAKNAFRPEFLNRVDEIIVFDPLGREQLLKIVDIMLNEVRSRTSECGITLEADEDAKKLLLEKGYDPKYGARPLRRAIQKMVEDSLSNMMLEGTVKAGDKVTVSAADGELRFETEKK
ncbi:MAG TPA: ATP-dependent Clp protease ATP-binding subunit [Synergistaceae bacterium]|jgi:ATP-dependent Clp protease ATP-binding subunit ClpC|nr:ATP-dependent Clp protease ATP-binding subunit [Synergistaceae bacterium]NLL40712.1 ATP-dependent Clp protease ATP-binding subunit [Synergistaceae bacterium]HPX03789.1 ATP-dependent Clp protease ATP-binding subunit [Synergistaceae bacterium]HQA54695.1 ATP-dependent Clp protease ATP-binding subunit [Synergistaceae bacterium]